MPVTSGVPQGSVLGPTLFIYFINDLPNVSNLQTKIFADDTKAFTTISSDQDRIDLQHTIDQMYEWTETWQLKFNETKCKVLHIGGNNPKHNYTIGKDQNKVDLEETELEKDLGVMVDPLLNFESHIDSITKKASAKCYMILKNFTFRSKDILVPLFKTLIRPILEYANPVWNNNHRKCIDQIENVQRRFTKYIYQVKDLSYEDRLKTLKLPSLEYRRFRGDLIETFKIANEFYDRISVETLFDFEPVSRLRGHNHKITKRTFNKTQFKNFYSNRVINHWNKLPQDVVNADTINTFKNRIDKIHADLMYQTKLFTN